MNKVLIFVLIPFLNFAQYNCDAYLQKNDSVKYKACKILEGNKFYQFDERFQENYQKVIDLIPDYDYGYQQKSVAYLKSGDFVTWKKLIDRAVEINPFANLHYRAWCRYQFFRDYGGAILDFENFEKLITEKDQYYSANSDYEIHIAKAICYSAINQKDKAIEIIEKQLSNKNHSIGLYDYYQLGVTYFEVGKYDKALENFEKQSKVYDFAENIYFRAKVSKIRNKDYLDLKNLALKNYDEGKFMKDPYTHHFNKVYKKQIEDL